MNFRIFASGLVMILVYQVAIAAVVIWFVVHCEMAAGASARGAETVSAAARVSG